MFEEIIKTAMVVYTVCRGRFRVRLTEIRSHSTHSGWWCPFVSHVEPTCPVGVKGLCGHAMKCTLVSDYKIISEVDKILRCKQPVQLMTLWVLVVFVYHRIVPTWDSDGAYHGL